MLNAIVLRPVVSGPRRTSPLACEILVTVRRNTGSSSDSDSSNASLVMSFASCWSMGSRQGISAYMARVRVSCSVEE